MTRHIGSITRRLRNADRFAGVPVQADIVNAALVLKLGVEDRHEENKEESNEEMRGKGDQKESTRAKTTSCV